MNGDQTLNIIVRAKDEATKVLTQLETNVAKLQPAFQAMTVAGTAAFVGLTAVLYKTVQGAQEAEVAQARLAQVLRTSTDASDAQIKSLNEQSKALEKVGVVSADTITVAQGTFATFDMQTESIRDLIPAFLDMVVAEKGVNATTDDMISYANGLGQALQGNYASLSKRGFILDEDTKKIIENGTETERVKAIVEVLDSTYKDMNKTLRETSQGGMKGLMMQINAMSDSIGDTLIPILETFLDRIRPTIDNITEWVEKNKELVTSILLGATAIAGIVAVIGILGTVLPAIITGFTFLIAHIGTIAAVIGVASAAIALFASDTEGMGTKFEEFMQMIDEKTGIITLLKWSWDQISMTFRETLLPALQELGRVFSEFWEKIKPLEPYFVMLGKIIGGALVLVIYAVVLAIQGWIQIITAILALSVEFGTAIFTYLVKPVEVFIDTVKKAIEWLGKLLSKMDLVGKAKGVGSSIGASVGKILGFEHGGRVPGPEGMPVPIMAHGGEKIIPARSASSSNDSSGGSYVVNIYNPKVSSIEDANMMREQVEQALRDVTRGHKLSTI